MKLHSYLSPKCYIKKSPLGGKGIFARAEIKKGELVALWGGKVFSLEEIEKKCVNKPHFATHTVSIFDNFYLGPITENGFDDTEYFNHSCTPNVGVKGQIVIVARKKIHTNEELCFDYDTTETNAEGSFYCKCKSKSCRGLIDGSSWKNPNFCKKNREYLSYYINNKIEKIPKSQH